jgi:hypothetical protein
VALAEADHQAIDEILCETKPEWVIARADFADAEPAAE